jgi:hypothetical protein
MPCDRTGPSACEISTSAALAAATRRPPRPELKTLRAPATAEKCEAREAAGQDARAAEAPTEAAIDRARRGRRVGSGGLGGESRPSGASSWRRVSAAASRPEVGLARRRLCGRPRRCAQERAHVRRRKLRCESPCRFSNSRSTAPTKATCVRQPARGGVPDRFFVRKWWSRRQESGSWWWSSKQVFYQASWRLWGIRSRVVGAFGELARSFVGRPKYVVYKYSCKQMGDC